MSLPTINFLHFTVSEIWPGQNFKGQGHYGKVKSQIKVTPRHCTPTTPNQCPYKVINFLHLMLSEIEPRQDFIGQSHYGKVKGQIEVTPRCCTPTPKPMYQLPNIQPSIISNQVSTSYTLWFPRYSLDKILYVKVTIVRSKVKSRSHHDIAHIHPLTNVPTKYQLPTPYGFRDIARTRFSNSRSLQQGQRSNQGHTIMLHTYTP